MTDKPDLNSSSQPRAFEPDPDSARLKRNALIGFFILLAGIFVVVLILPALLTDKKEFTKNTSQTMPVRSDGISQAKLNEVEQLIKEALKIQARLENENVGVWGAEKLTTSYPEVLNLIAQADDNVDRQRYDQAIAGYRDVLEKLEQLGDSRRRRAERAIEQGDQAFARQDSRTAIDQYTIAVAADPAGIEAQIRLKRAENLAQVLRFIKQGGQLEQDGEIELAWQKYREAVMLDREFQPAIDHLQRLNTVISDSEFRQAMGEAQTALLAEDITKATAALGAARGIKPDDASVRDLAQQLENVTLRIGHQQLGEEALAHEQNEQWAMAAEVYDRILEVDATAGYALQGKSRVANQMAMIGEIEGYLKQPDRLKEPEYREHAREIITLALAQSGSGPKFLELARQLNALLDEYNQTVPVSLQSDSLTEVRIYRVGRLGSFTQRNINLLPGDYTAAGSRSGYRDVQIPFTVPVAGEAINVEVICTEPI